MEESWDSSELPTKFNKYKRLKEREAAATNGQHFQNCSSQQPSTSTNSSETNSVQPAPLADAVSSLTTCRSSDSPRAQPNELCPDGLALKKRLVSVPQSGMTLIGNGCHLPFEDTPSSQEYADCLRLGPHPGSSLLSCSFDGVVHRNRASPLQHTQKVGGSPRLVRLAGEQRLSECRCGACSHCVRPLSANSCSSQYVRSTDVPHLYDAPLNLTVSSSRTSQSTSQWRHGTNNAEQQRYATQTMPAPENGSSRVVDEHFERSLGIGYARLVQNPSSASDNSAIDASKLGSRQTNASDCVDDHFSKSLGDLWPRVKDNGNTAAARHGVSDQFVSNVAKNSVDDHFTKALGAKTWNEIKASTEKTVSRYPT